MDIEVQGNSEGAHIRRARYHSSVLDSRMLKEGQEFKEIKDSYVIFIYKHDKFQEGLPLYHIDRYVRETGKLFEDGSHIIYVNGNYKGDDEIGHLMQDFHQTDPDNMHYKELSQGVRHFKEVEEGFWMSGGHPFRTDRSGTETVIPCVKQYRNMRRNSGDEWRQLAGVRSFMVYMLTHPGKKLTFMGAELGQWHEWDFAGQLDWYLLENDANRRMQDFFRAVNRYYLTNPALWRIDFDWAGFEWLVADDNEDNTVVFVRRDGAGEELLVAVNFSPNGYRDYRFGVPPRKTWREELSTDDTAFGGTGEWRNEKPVRTQAIPSHGREQSIAITIPPLGAVILRGAGEYKKPKAKKSKAREELPA